MWNAIPIALRNQEVMPQPLQIGQAIQIAKIPQEMHELRLSAFINHVCQTSNEQTDQLTVQERYYLLLNYLALSNNDYMMDGTEVSDYLTQKLNAPDVVTVANGINFQQLRGYHATFLQGKCENIYDWIVGQIALQLFGDVTSLFDKSENPTPIVWQQPTSKNHNELNGLFNERFAIINSMPESDFEELYRLFCVGADELSHLVTISVDNEGFVLKANKDDKDTGDGDDRFARFRPIDAVSGTTKRIIECLV